jgi:hypothetical protein
MKKVRYSKSDPASFHRSITHIAVDGDKAAYRCGSGETFSLERRVSAVRCHILDLFHRVKLRLDGAPDPELETLECRFFFTKTVLVGGGNFIRLFNQAVTFVRTEEPYLCERNFFKAKLLKITEDDRLASRWRSDIHLSRFRSEPESFGERGEVAFPAFSIPQDFRDNPVQLEANLFDALIHHLAKHQNNTELQAWVEIEGYFGNSGIALLDQPAGSFQFVRIKQFIIGNLMPIRSSKPVLRLPADFMYTL